MPHVLLLIIAVLALAFAGETAAARTCFPVETEVVSLGENNARAYTDRSLQRAIAARKTSLEASGRSVGRVTRAELDCAPYPNIIGADEWRCTGSARVCAAD
jgi:hypothetical protein